MKNWQPTARMPDGGFTALPLEAVRILVVEDEPLIAMCVEAALRDFGAIVFVAMNEAEALRLLEQVSSFDLLLTDVNIGAGASGFDIARVARQRDPSTAVIYLSGRSETSVQRQGVAQALYLSKPVTEANLVRTATDAVAKMRRLQALTSCDAT